MNDLGCVTSQILVMLEQERAEAYRCIDYLSYRTELSPADRQALCNWGYQIIAAFPGISRLTGVKAISYFDRYMRFSSQGREELETIQLAFVASLLIALKVDSGFRVEIDFVAHVFTNDAYNEEDIERMEMKVLQALGWRLSGPAPHDFIDKFLDAIPRIETMHRAFLRQLSKAVAEVAITRYCIALQHPSVIAFSAICCGLEYLKTMFAIDTLAIRRSLEIVFGFDCNDLTLKSVIKTMVHIMLDISLDDLSSFVRPAETDSSSVSSEDSPVSIFLSP